MRSPTRAGSANLKDSFSEQTNPGSRMKRLLNVLPLLVLSLVGLALPSLAQPVTTHPRLWITQADLPRLRALASPGNPLYSQALQPALADAVATYQTRFFPGGVAAVPFPDEGSTNWEPYPVEAYAEFFAFHSLVDPSPSARIQYAQYARNLLMYAMDRAVLGAAPGVPFRHPAFSTFNRASWWGEGFPLTVDWIYDAVDGSGQRILTAADRATIRTVFLRWTSECLNAATSGNEHPQPVGVVNSPALLSDPEQLRWGMNNYYQAHARQVTLMALALDAADDPGGTLRGYVANATGAWLYQEYALLEEAPKVIAAYGLPAGTTGLGAGSGGIPPEGHMYGAAVGHVLESLLALRTAGYDDPALSGPQIELIRSGYWDRWFAAILGSLAPAPRVFPEVSYLGPLYQMSAHGDILHLYMPTDWSDPFGVLAALDRSLGNEARLAKSRWVMQNVVEGGSDAFLDRARNIWGNAYAKLAILHFLAFEPGAATANPRTSLPTVHWDPSAGQLLARTDWGSQATLFSFRSSWKTISHQVGDSGGFDFLWKGEWLTKELSGYSDNGNIGTPQYKNSLSIQNRCSCPSGQPGNLQWYEGTAWSSGGQWLWASAAGDPSTLASTGPDWAFVSSDLTNLYNRPDVWTPANSATDVLHASRSVAWLSPDHVVVYDRADTATAGLFKRFHLNLVTSPVVAGNFATETLPGGQQLFVTTVQPAAATTSVSSIASVGDLIASLEPGRYRMTVEDPSNPSSVRFLHVLQGADAGHAVDPILAVSTSGRSSYTGVAVAGRTVLFPVEPRAAFSSFSFSPPAGTTRHLVTGLVPGGRYDVAVAPGGSPISVTPGTARAADAAGVLEISTRPGTSFHTLPPCRIVDTRGAAGTYGAPALQPAGVRDFPIAGACGVPADATAVAANVTAVTPAAPGSLSLFPAGVIAPQSSVVSLATGKTRASNAILSLQGTPAGTLRVFASTEAPVDLLVDVSGYFR